MALTLLKFLYYQGQACPLALLLAYSSRRLLALQMQARHIRIRVQRTFAQTLRELESRIRRAGADMPLIRRTLRSIGEAAQARFAIRISGRAPRTAFGSDRAPTRFRIYRGIGARHAEIT